MISETIFNIIAIFVKGIVIFFTGSMYILGILICFYYWKEKKYLGAIALSTVLFLFTLIVIATILKHFGL